MTCVANETSRWERVAAAVWAWHRKTKPWSAADAAARRDYRAGSERALAVIDSSRASDDDLAAEAVRAAFSVRQEIWDRYPAWAREPQLECGRLIVAAAGETR